MVRRHGTELSIRRQCDLLSLPRSTFYYQPEPPSPEELELMLHIDQLYTECPFYGSRRITRELRKQGRSVNRKCVQRLMRIMGLEGLAPGPNTSRPHPEHIKYPYLLKGLAITRPNQVWATDITYIPLEHGFVYLVAIIDWYSRYVLAWRLSNTLDTAFCVDALEEALERWGKPEIFNTDQGAQFTAQAFTDVLKAHEVQISMDGKGRCRDNIFVERLWRSLKYEEVYLKTYADQRDARRNIAAYFTFFNNRRGHQGLGYDTPAAVYFRPATDPQAVAA
jgi:putative transposase